MQRQGHQRGKVADTRARGVRVGGVTGGKGERGVYCDPAAVWRKARGGGLDDMNNTTQTANRNWFFFKKHFNTYTS